MFPRRQVTFVRLGSSERAVSRLRDLAVLRLYGLHGHLPIGRQGRRSHGGVAAIGHRAVARPRSWQPLCRFLCQPGLVLLPPRLDAGRDFHRRLRHRDETRAQLHCRRQCGGGPGGRDVEGPVLCPGCLETVRRGRRRPGPSGRLRLGEDSLPSKAGPNAPRCPKPWTAGAPSLDNGPGAWARGRPGPKWGGP
jgi:hypothetical protein